MIFSKYFKSYDWRFPIWIISILLIVTADQLTKLLIIKLVPIYEKISINTVINITHHKNSGAAFSFLADAGGWQRWFLMLISISVIVIIILWLWQIRYKKQNLLITSFLLIFLKVARVVYS